MNEETAQGIYSNLAIITHSSAEFVVDFVGRFENIEKDLTINFDVCAPIVVPIKYTHEDKNLNIVFLLADDLRWNSLGCMGNSMLQTENIDACV